MAIGRRKDNLTKLAELVGGATNKAITGGYNLYKERQEKNEEEKRKEEIGDMLEAEGYPREWADLDPARLNAMMRVRAAKTTAEGKQQQQEQQKVTIDKQLQRLDEVLKMKEQQSGLQKAGLWASKTYKFGGDKADEEATAIIKGIAGMPGVSKLGLATPLGKDDPEVIRNWMKQTREEMGIPLSKEEEKEKQEAAPQQAEQEEASEEQVGRRKRGELRRLAKKEQGQQEDEISEENALQAMDDQEEVQQDSLMQADQQDALMQDQMQQLGLEPQQQMPQRSPQQQMAMDPQQQQIVDQMSQQGNQQQLGARTAPGEQQQGMSLEGLPEEALDVLRSALAGGAGVGRQAGDLLSGIKGGIQGMGQSMAESLPENARAQFDEAQALSEEGTQLEDMVRKIPARNEIFKSLGGKEAAPGTQARAIQEFAGDVPEQLAWSMMFGSGVTRKLLGNIMGAQGAGNFAKWLATSTGSSEETGDMIKTGIAFLTSMGLSDSLEKVSKETYDKARSEVPTSLRFKDADPVGTKAWNIKQQIQNGETGFAGSTRIFDPFIEGNPTYHDGFEAIKELETNGFPTPSLKRGIKVFRKYLLDDMKSNPQVPKEATQLFKEASQMWAQNNQAQKANNFLSGLRQVGSVANKGGFGGLASIGLLGFLNPKVAPIAAAAYTGKKAVDLYKAAKLFATSDGMRKYYTRMIKSALEGDGVNAAKQLFSLNKMIEHKQKKDK